MSVFFSKDIKWKRERDPNEIFFYEGEGPNETAFSGVDMRKDRIEMIPFDRCVCFNQQLDENESEKKKKKLYEQSNSAICYSNTLN